MAGTCGVVPPRASFDPGGSPDLGAGSPVGTTPSRLPRLSIGGADPGRMKATWLRGSNRHSAQLPSSCAGGPPQPPARRTGRTASEPTPAPNNSCSGRADRLPQLLWRSCRSCCRCRPVTGHHSSGAWTAQPVGAAGPSPLSLASSCRVGDEGGSGSSQPCQRLSSSVGAHERDARRLDGRAGGVPGSATAAHPTATAR